MSKSNQKKYFNATMVATLVASTVAGGSVAGASAEFSDVKTTDYFFEAVKNLSERGIVNGFPDGTFKPYNNVTRGQAAVIISGALGLDTVNVQDPGFKDVPTSHPYYGAIAALANAGYINGFEDGTFGADKPVTRNHMAIIISKAFNLEAPAGTTLPFSDIYPAYKNQIAALYANGVTAGNSPTTFGGSLNVTRGQLAQFIVKAENAGTLENTDTFTIEGVSEGTIQTSDGALSIDPSLHAIFNVANANVLKGAEVQAVVIDGEVKLLSSITINASATVNKPFVLNGGNTITNADIKVNGDYVSIDKLTVNGDVTVSNKVENKFTANELVTNGKFIIEADLTSPVASLNGFIAAEDDDKKGPEIELNKSTIKSLVAERNNLTLNSDTKLVDVTISSQVSAIEINADIEKVTVDQTGTLNLNIVGKVNELVISNNKTNVTLGVNAEVAKLITPEGSNIQDVISNYSSVKGNISEVVNDKGDKVTTNTGGGNSSSNNDDDDDDNEVTTGDSGTIDDEEDGAPITVERLQLSSDSLNVDEEKTIDFRLKYNGTPVEQLVLLEKNGTSYTPYKDVKLLDNGIDPDLIKGDSIYGARVNITETQSGIRTLVVGVQENGQWKEVSRTATIITLQPLTSADAAVVVQTESVVKTKVDTLKAEGKTVDEIKEAVVQSLLENEDVVEAGASVSGNQVWYALKSGALSAVSILENNVATIAQPMNLVAMNTMSMDFMPVNDVAAVSPSATTSTVGNQRVIIFSAHGQTAGVELETALNSANVPFSVTHLKDGDANVEQFKTMFDYGTVIFDTKGAALFKGDFEEFPYLSNLFNANEEQVVILTGEEVTESTLQTYNADLKTGRLVTVDGYYAITPAFVEHYSKLKDTTGSLVYANAPYSFYNNTLANQFIAQNGTGYVGYENAVTPSQMVDSFTSLLAGESLKDAVNTEKIAGNDSISYAKTADLTNGSFEEGETHWISGGHFDTVSILGDDQNQDWATLRPTNGSDMGIISSGIDETVLDGRQSWVYQTFTVPEDMNVLKFDYNVVSNEPMEFLGSSFNDTFKATIVEGAVKEPKASNVPNDYYYEDSYNYSKAWLDSTVDENETIIAYETINSSDWGQYEENSDIQRVDVEFDEGDRTTYMTGWKTATVDVTKYQGKTITLKLQTWDLGDTAYPTAVLFDRVHFAQSEVEGLQIDGVKSAFIPHNGNYEYQMNAFYVDQFNEQIRGEITLHEDANGHLQPIYKQQGTFSLKTDVTGVSIDSTTGLLTVSDEATEGNVTVVANGTKGIAEHTIQLKLEPETDYTDKQEYIYVDNSENAIEVTFSYNIVNGIGSDFDFTTIDSATVTTDEGGTFVLTTADAAGVSISHGYDLVINLPIEILGNPREITLTNGNEHLTIRLEDNYEWVIDSLL